MVLSNQRAMQLCSLTFGWTWLLLLLFSFGSFLGAISTQPIWKVVYDRAVDEDRLGKHRASRYQQCFNNTLDWLRLDTAMAWETVCGQKARAPVVAFQGVIVKWFSCLASMDTSSGTNSLEFIAIIRGILPTSPGWCMSFDCFSLTAGKGLMIWSRM